MSRHLYRSKNRVRVNAIRRNVNRAVIFFMKLTKVDAQKTEALLTRGIWRVKDILSEKNNGKEEIKRPDQTQPV